MVKCKILQRGYNMNEIIEKILIEWSYRVNDGMPNPKNPQHIYILRQSMEKLNLPKDFIFEYIQSLLSEKMFYSRSKQSGKIVQYKDKDRWKDGLKSGTHEKVSDEEVAKELGKKDDKKDTKTHPLKNLNKNHQNQK